ncbi:hypothetical protein D1872_220040 [compost metagenome]
MLHRERFAGFVGNFQIAQISLDISLQIDLPLFHELHDGCGREQFGDRGDPEDGVFRIYRLFAPDIGITVSFLKQDLVSLDENNRCAC